MQPDLVKCCFRSVIANKGKFTVKVIDKSNFDEYVNFPGYIVKKWRTGIIPNALFSDLLRLELLIKNGGLWMDATVLLSGGVPNYILSSDLFLYRNGNQNKDMINIGNWLIYSKKSNNPLLVMVRDMLYLYWHENNYVKNYFIFHMFFRMITDKFPELLEHMIPVNQINQHLLMNDLNHIYSNERYKDITELTNVHKLTYKGIDYSVENSTFQYILDSYSE